MREIRLILIQVFAFRFYRNNVSLFLLILVFAGGFMRSSDHIALAEYFISSPVLLLIPLCVWLIYAYLVLDFNRNTVSLGENLFLMNFFLLPTSWQWHFSFWVALHQLAPVYLYAFFLLVVCIKNGLLYPAIFMIITPSLITILITWSLKRFLLHPDFQKDIGTIFRWVGKIVTRPFVFFSLEWALRKQTLALAGYKITGMALLWSTLYLYSTDEYDIRLAGIGVVFSFALNITFILSYHRFLHLEFSLFRQMPFSLIQRYGYAFLILILFTAPEAMLLVRNFPPGFAVYCPYLLMAFGWSINLLFYNFLFVKERTPEKVMPFVYFMCIALFLGTLANVSIGWLILFNMSVSFYFAWKHYYLFEYQSSD